MECLKIYVEKIDNILNSLYTIDECWKATFNLSDGDLALAASLAKEYCEVCYSARKCIIELISADAAARFPLPLADSIVVDPHDFHISTYFIPGAIFDDNGNVVNENDRRLDAYKTSNSMTSILRQCATVINASVNCFIGEYSKMRDALPEDLSSALGDALLSIAERTTNILKIIEEIKYMLVCIVSFD